VTTVTLRYFAAARSAAGGVRQEDVTAATVTGALDQAKDKHGAELARVMGISSYLLNGVSLAEQDHGVVLDGPATLDVMPPFAGG